MRARIGIATVRAIALVAVGALAGPAACNLITGEIACNGDEDCPAGKICGGTVCSSAGASTCLADRAALAADAPAGARVVVGGTIDDTNGCYPTLGEALLTDPVANMVIFLPDDTIHPVDTTLAAPVPGVTIVGGDRETSIIAGPATIFEVGVHGLKLDTLTVDGGSAAGPPILAGEGPGAQQPGPVLILSSVTFLASPRVAVALEEMMLQAFSTQFLTGTSVTLHHSGVGGANGVSFVEDCEFTEAPLTFTGTMSTVTSLSTFRVSSAPGVTFASDGDVTFGDLNELSLAPGAATCTAGIRIENASSLGGVNLHRMTALNLPCPAIVVDDTTYPRPTFLLKLGADATPGDNDFSGTETAVRVVNITQEPTRIDAFGNSWNSGANPVCGTDLVIDDAETSVYFLEFERCP